MNLHTTNYTNTFITVAEDCPAKTGEIPPAEKDRLTAAAIQHECIIKHPYQYTSDDILFLVYALHNELSLSEYDTAREVFFSKDQPCFRSSPLPRRYGWGVHFDARGKIAIYGMETPDYKKFAEDRNLNVIQAMRSSKLIR
ncbi:MAG: hypothetical protein KDD36_00970 [Flavobacteriales bacterium]|nr:hypothetical protein [Flavobacteriales bacterium]